MDNFGKELILDIHNADTSKFTREELERYFSELCELIDMERDELHFWDDLDVPEEERQTEPHTKGTSAIQFILTSNITIHTLDELAAVYVNIFSCKDFDEFKASKFTKEFFNGEIITDRTIDRV